MSLSREQKKELKKIDSQFRLIEELSERTGAQVDDLPLGVGVFDYFPNEHQKKKVFERNRKREDVYRSGGVTKKSKVSSGR